MKWICPIPVKSQKTTHICLGESSIPKTISWVWDMMSITLKGYSPT